MGVEVGIMPILNPVTSNIRQVCGRLLPNVIWLTGFVVTMNNSKQILQYERLSIPVRVVREYNDLIGWISASCRKAELEQRLLTGELSSLSANLDLSYVNEVPRRELWTFP